MRSRTAEQRTVADSGEDPRVVALRISVDRIRRELAGHPAELPERAAAEEELAALESVAKAGAPEVPGLRDSLLLIAGALGSVSALSPALAELRRAIELFGDPPSPAARH